MSKKHHIIPIFVPHYGCPHDCVFCNQKKITGLSTDVTDEQVKKIIDEYLETIPKTNEVLEIAFFGGSFTGINEESQEKLLRVAKFYKDSGIINRIRLSTRPDYISPHILEFLKKNGVDVIELGVQSLDENVLHKSSRGHTADDVYKAVELIKGYGFLLGLQMMVGLPGDSKDKAISTAQKIADQYPDFVRVYPTLVIKETYLEEMLLNGNYQPLSLEEAVNICCDILIIFYSRDIPVIRLGLQPTDNVAEDKDIIAGPFHPSIRQLVESRIYNRVLMTFFDNNHIDGDEVVFKVNKGEISNFVGQKSSNIAFLRNRYGFKKIKTYAADISKDFFYTLEGKTQHKIEIKEYVKKLDVN